MPLGIYISVPFCKSKCSYCNFASGVFSKQVFKRYVDRVVQDISSLPQQTFRLSSRAKRGICISASDQEPDRHVDSLYLGGGTPTLLEPTQLERLFTAVRENFDLAPNAEVTVECAPGTLTPEVIETLLRCGVNRVSLGVQSFVDKEASSVARLHTRAVTLEEIARLREHGIDNINIDLIAGLPHQTRESWEDSLSQLIDTGVPHASIYMLEVDEDSRLGRELIAGGTKYHAHHVPDDDLTADLYERACERLNAAGITQYEISNFARPGRESRHNLKYWTRQPYLGFGGDAHSMLPTGQTPGVPHPLAVLWRKGGVRETWDEESNRNHNEPSLCHVDDAPTERARKEGGDIPTEPRASKLEIESTRFSTTDNLERYIAGEPHEETPIAHTQALEEAFFLGLRLNRGIDLNELSKRYGKHAATTFLDELDELESQGLIEREATYVRLTNRGRLLSNEVFARFITPQTAATAPTA